MLFVMLFFFDAVCPLCWWLSVHGLWLEECLVMLVVCSVLFSKGHALKVCHVSLSSSSLLVWFRVFCFSFLFVSLYAWLLWSCPFLMFCSATQHHGRIFLLLLVLWQKLSMSDNSDIDPLFWVDEVSGDIVIAGHYRSCCCWKSQNVCGFNWCSKSSIFSLFLTSLGQPPIFYFVVCCSVVWIWNLSGHLSILFSLTSIAEILKYSWKYIFSLALACHHHLDQVISFTTEWKWFM